MNPSSTKYAFVGAENKELVFLNDLRWTQEEIPWQEFQNLLEGHSVHLTAPKFLYARNLLITKDIPIFVTRIAPIMYAKKGANTEGETLSLRHGCGRFDCLFQSQCLIRKLPSVAQDSSRNFCFLGS